jgi:hypothetical protein
MIPTGTAAQYEEPVRAARPAVAARAGARPAVASAAGRPAPNAATARKATPPQRVATTAPRKVAQPTPPAKPTVVATQGQRR